MNVPNYIGLGYWASPDANNVKFLHATEYSRIDVTKRQPTRPVAAVAAPFDVRLRPVPNVGCKPLIGL